VAAGGGGATASQTFKLAGLSAPTFSSTLDGTQNFDVTSNLVITVSEAVTAVAGKFIRIVNDGGPGHNGEATVNTQSIAANDTTQVTIVGNTIQINPQFDLDFANSYHVEIDAGAFVGTTSSVESVAISDSTTLDFTTVMPSATSTAEPSLKMSGDSMVPSFGWWEAEGNSAPGGNPVTRDFANGDFALVATDLGTAGIATDNFYIRADNFGVGDRLYFDNRGDNTLARQGDFDGAGMILDFGQPPTVIISAASGTATGTDGGQIDVSLAGNRTGDTFADTEALKLLLGVPYQPVVYG